MIWNRVVTILVALMWTGIAWASAGGDFWFQGSVEEAFAKAKGQGKPLFLYWGAQWCPPCNEMKAMVFSNPRFEELMKPYIAVYLDGDSDRAQAWGEKLGAQGYPTILLFRPDGQETMRLDTELDFGEFEQALLSAASRQDGIDAAIAQARADKASPQDWLFIASYSFDQSGAGAYKADKLVPLLEGLLQKVPPSLEAERTLLTGKYLGALVSRGEGVKLSDAERHAAPAQLGFLLETPQRIRASRSFLISHGADLVFALDQPKEGAVYQTWKARLLQAAATLGGMADVSADNRLWGQAIALDLQQLESTKGPVPPELKAAISAAVARADQEAKTPYERKAVIAGAAELLTKVGAAEDARQMLIKEAKVSDTPWYYYSSLSHLEQGEQHLKEAAAWSQKARETAKGAATKIQWITADLLFRTKETAKGAGKDLLPVMKEYYDTALTLEDGFLGRNRLRAARVATGLKPWVKEAALNEEVRRQSLRCSRLKADNQKGCTEHFLSLLEGPTPKG